MRDWGAELEMGGPQGLLGAGASGLEYGDVVGSLGRGLLLQVGCSGAF